MKIKLICLFIGILFMTIQSVEAVTKCYKDICVGQTVIVSEGLYKGNQVKILDIIKERIPDVDEEEMKDYFKYFVSFKDGSIGYLYREELKLKED